MKYSYIAASAATTAFIGNNDGFGYFASRKRQNQLRWISRESRQPVRLLSPKSSVDNSTHPVASPYATSYHAPVMCQACVDALLESRNSLNRKVSDREGKNGLVFVDGTLGGGGHSSAILERLRPGDVLFGCDVDPHSLAYTTSRLEKYTVGNPGLPLFVPVQCNFCDLATKLPALLHPKTSQSILETPASCVDGVLLDLGVSSHQIDTAERGFAFMKEGPLDMRMGDSSSRGGLTAADVCNEFDESELKRILKHYGDEPRAAKVARSIVEHRPLSTTFDLVESVSAVTPAYVKRSKRMGRTATLARVFQSLRIVVNQEDTVLEKVFEHVCPTLIRPGGRLVVLSYHSAEDRATKRVMKSGSVKQTSRALEKDIYGNYIGPPRPWKVVGKLRKASEEEVVSNSRARSAILRVAERLETPAS